VCVGYGGASSAMALLLALLALLVGTTRSDRPLMQRYDADVVGQCVVELAFG
jgi:hypothetical protein